MSTETAQMARALQFHHDGSVAVTEKRSFITWNELNHVSTRTEQDRPFY